jgi:hypothetical protein
MNNEKFNFSMYVLILKEILLKKILISINKPYFSTKNLGAIFIKR